MPFVSVNDTRLWVEDTGPGSTGETVVMSHGLLFDLELFRHQIERLRGRYRVVAWDHRGQGKSADDPRDVVGLELLTDDALALFEALHVGRPHFLGLSMGGFVGMRLAGRHPGLLRSLTLLNTTAEPEPSANVPKYRALNFLARTLGVGAVIDRVMPILFGRTTMTSPSRASMRAAWRAHLAGNRRTVWRAVNGVLAREGIEHLLPRVAVPTLVVVGEEDVATVPEKGERIRAAVRGARLLRLAEAGHSSAIERADAVSDALEAHLRG